MIEYIIAFLVCILCIQIKTNRNKIGYYLPVIVLFILCAFRGEKIGTDTIEYLTNFSDSDKVLAGFDFFSYRGAELISNYIFYIVDKYHLPPRLILITYALLTFIPIVLICKKQNLDLPLFCFFFLTDGSYLQSYNIARQIASVMVAMYACTYIFKEKKSYLFFLFTVVAGMIHTSGFYLLPLYIFRWLHVSHKVVYVPLIIVALLTTTGIVNFYSLLSYVSIGELYSQFYGDQISNQSISLSIIGFIVSLYSIILLLYSLKFQKKQYVAFFAFCILVKIMTLGWDASLARITLVFTNMLIILYAVLFEEIRRESQHSYNKLLYIFTIISFSAKCLMYIVSNKEIYPYEFGF